MFGGVAFGAGGVEAGARLGEALGVAGVEGPVGELVLQRRDFGGERLDASGQGFERVLVLEGELARRGARGGLRLRRLGRGGLPGGRLRGHARAALGDHVAVAAGVFDEAAVAFRHDDGGGDAIEEVAVVADQQHGAGIIGQHFLEHVEGFEVEIVGRLVEHQKIARPREGPRQQQPSALAARERAHLLAHLFGGEEELLQIADHMAGDAADAERVAAAAGQRVGDREIGVEGGALLVEPSEFDIGPERHRAGVGFEPPGQQFQQRRLARAVRADHADPVAAQDAGGEIAHDGHIAIGFGDRLRLDHPGAGGRALRRRHHRRARRLALLAPGRAQRIEAGEAALVALAPRGDAVAQPVLLAGDLAVELVAFELLLRQHLVAPGLEGREAALHAPRAAAIEPDDGAREPLQEAAVVADEDERRGHRLKLALQPFDGRQVEMVGRLVEQQNVRAGGERAGERRAAGLAARQMRRVLGPGEAQLVQQIERAVRIVALGEARLDIGERGLEAGEVGLLRQIADGGGGVGETLAAVGLGQTGGDLQQRRLARAVAPDQR